VKTIKPVISIIIINYNTKELLWQCINSILQNDKRLTFSPNISNFKNEAYIPAEIIIIDNGSTDGSVKMINHQLSTITHRPLAIKLIKNQTNLGFGKANNRGMQVAKGEYILLLNSDTEVKEGAISQTLLWFSSHPEFDIIGCKLINPDGCIQPSAGKFPTLINVCRMLFFDRIIKKRQVMFSPKKITKVDWIMGAFMLLRKEVFRKSKGFDENIFMYMEEVEWCYRLKKFGFRIGFYPNAKIIHFGGASSKRGVPIINIYRGLIYFYQKHKSKNELFILKLMLKVKALLSLSLGIISNNDYLKKTYQQALAIS